MTYQALARKWRPQDFSSLIGQQPIVTALQNALTEGRISQAYIFSGIRGVGKTTAARLLAKALNCEHGPAADPCNACPACHDITIGSDLDVVEVDAATYSKVEQVRDLTESLQYSPARDRYKVVVIDEIHRLSRQAFDALLKIVEEPPPHLVFIFATTEIEAIPATVLSRCQEYHFRRVAAPEVASHLRRLADAEGIEASDRALQLLARAGGGSVRDSLALLDQLATFGRGAVSEEEAARLVGGLDLDLFARLLRSILDGESHEIAAAVRGLEDLGLDPRQVYGHFLLYCRDAIHLAVGAEVELPHDDRVALAEIVAEAGYENLLRLLHHLLSSESLVRRSESSALAVEIAWMRAAELPRLVRVESLLRGEKVAASPPRQERSDGDQPPSRPPAPAKLREAPPRPASREEPLEAVLEAISRRKQPLAAHLREAQSLRIEDGELRIRVEPGDDWLERALQKPVNREVLEEALKESLGPGTGWKLLEGQGTEARPAPPLPPGEVVQDPTVQAVLDIFGGRVETVDRETED